MLYVVPQRWSSLCYWLWIRPSWALQPSHTLCRHMRLFDSRIPRYQENRVRDRNHYAKQRNQMLRDASVDPSVTFRSYFWICLGFVGIPLGKMIEIRECSSAVSSLHSLDNNVFWQKHWVFLFVLFLGRMIYYLTVRRWQSSASVCERLPCCFLEVWVTTFLDDKRASRLNRLATSRVETAFAKMYIEIALWLRVWPAQQNNAKALVTKAFALAGLPILVQWLYKRAREKEKKGERKHIKPFQFKVTPLADGQS